MLEQITPLILTRNEAPNIGRTLRQLCWASDIIIIDSFSEDDTVEIVSTFPQTRVFQRQFDRHDRQWNFGLRETGIRTEWVLALDSDYLLTEASVAELASLKPASATHGYRAKFQYCINGRPLRSGIYSPVTILYRQAHGCYAQDGHTQKLLLPGKIENLNVPIRHDDRKSLKSWLDSQTRYTELEAEKLLKAMPSELDLPDRLRRWWVVAPLAVAFYCLILRGGVLDGWAGFYYAFQRLLAELMLSLRLLEEKQRTKSKERRARGEEQRAKGKGQRARSKGQRAIL
jgi:glycosyltransferase involved in cell wall biosynthesis